MQISRTPLLAYALPSSPLHPLRRWAQAKRGLACMADRGGTDIVLAAAFAVAAALSEGVASLTIGSVSDGGGNVRPARM